jgi:diguanylate cyclase (GGDEF)-like protein/PAS domain S-box-containing protein
MRVLFDNNDLHATIQRFQELINECTVGHQLHKLEPYIEQILHFLNDFSNLKNALDVSIIVAVTDVKGDIIYANEKFCEISKYRREELMGQNHRILKSGYHDKAFFRNMWKTIANGNIWEGEVKNKAKDGTLYWVKTTIVPIMNDQNKPVMYIAFRTDITEGKLAQEELVTALRNDFRLVVNSMYNVIFKAVKDDEKGYIYVLSEGQLGNQLGIEGAKMLGKSPKEVYPLRLAEMLEEKYRKAFLGEPVTYTYTFNQTDLLTYLSPVYEDGKIVEIIGVINDITELSAAQEEIKFMAFHDMLTNLPNRRKFKDDLTELINKCSRDNSKFAVFFIDLDRFKQINDSLGHTIGDTLIQAVASRLDSFIRKSGQLYRFAGDEFVILRPFNSQTESVSKIAVQILEGFEQSFQLSDSLEMYTTVSIGISIFPDHGKDNDSLLKNADTAMFVSKSESRNTFNVYRPEMNQNHEEILLIEQYLRNAIENHELELYFQPKLNLHTGKVDGMEALLRWKSPSLGMVPPDKFIPIAEETGLIMKIDDWVLEEACRQNEKWNKELFLEPIRVAVNISPVHFRLPNFVSVIENVLEKTGLKPELLEIEITEGSFIENVEECIESLNKLRQLGVSVAIDDFGKGYSSLNYLRKFPITSLKIDQTFIQEVAQNSEDVAIVKAIIYLSHELNLKVVAEGTETEEVVDLLKELGCHEVQGFYFSRPLSKGDFEQRYQTMIH